MCPSSPVVEIHFGVQGDDFVVACQLLKFETIYNWWYTGCAKCNGKPKAMDQNVPKSPLFCGICKKTPDKTEPKYVPFIQLL